MRLEHHLVGGYVRYISPYIIIIIKVANGKQQGVLCVVHVTSSHRRPYFLGSADRRESKRGALSTRGA